MPQPKLVEKNIYLYLLPLRWILHPSGWHPPSSFSFMSKSTLKIHQKKSIFPLNYKQNNIENLYLLIRNKLEAKLKTYLSISRKRKDRKHIKWHHEETKTNPGCGAYYVTWILHLQKSVAWGKKNKQIHEKNIPQCQNLSLHPEGWPWISCVVYHISVNTSPVCNNI